MSSNIINPGSVQWQTVLDLAVDPKGSLALPLTLNWSVAAQYTIELGNYIAQNKIGLVQAVFVDNRAGTTPMTINSQGSQQTLQIPAGKQAYLMLLSPNPPYLQFASADGVNTSYVWLLNFPVSNHVWDTGTDATSSVEYSGGIVGPALVANETVTGDAANTTAALITGAPGYYIAGVSMQLTSTATLTAGTDLQVTLTDSSSGAVATVNLSPTTGLFGAILGVFWNNKTANSSLKLTFSTSLSAGELYYTISYGQVTKLIGS
jgi:hypothetical protein